MIEFDATLVVQMINFAIFLFILRKMLFGPLVNHIEERRRVILTVEAIGTVVDGQSVVDSIETKLAFFDPICYTTNYAPKVWCKPVLNQSHTSDS